MNKEAANSEPVRRYAFGSFYLDAHRRTLSEGLGKPVEMSAKAFDTLLFLVEHPGESVSRDDLMAALWPEAIVEDNTLSRAVMQVRRALGPGFVVTLKGHGYQFVADVRRRAEQQSPESDSKLPSQVSSSDESSRSGASVTHSGSSNSRSSVGSSWSDYRLVLLAGASLLSAILVAVFLDPLGGTRSGVDSDSTWSGVRALSDEPRAVDFYDSARTYELMQHDGDPHFVVRQYRRALEIDPDFALAWARLSIAENELFWFQVDPSEARKQLSWNAGQRALALQPDLPEALMALGWYHYHIDQDWDIAITQLERAIAAMGPDSELQSELHWRLGIVYRRSGELDRALAQFEKIPATSSRMKTTIETLLFSRQYSTAQTLLDQFLELHPTDSVLLDYNAMIPLLQHGDVTALRSLVDSRGLEVGAKRLMPKPVLGWMVALFDRDFDAAIESLEFMNEGAWRTDRRYLSKDALSATTLELAGERDQALQYWQRALAHAQAVLEQNPHYLEARVALAEAMARVGSASEAMSLAEGVIAHYQEKGDRISTAEHRLDVARRVLVPLGALDEATEHLARYLREPGMWSFGGLATDPRLEPLQDHPQFALIGGEQRTREPG